MKVKHNEFYILIETPTKPHLKKYHCKLCGQRVPGDDASLRKHAYAHYLRLRNLIP